jgi:molybdenum cofactor cytidylyltransferase
MDLVHAMRIGSNESIAFTGAGGKTTALFRLAHLLPSPVLVTTTTHFAIDQLALADHIIILTDSSNIGKELANQSGEVILLIGEERQNNRVSGLSSITLQKVDSIARERGISLLIEADGSRQRPLKAPANHEPVIPNFVDSVVVVAGLSALGKPIAEQWVHRPELFADLVGLKPGDAITSEAIVRALLNTSGGLKGIPPGAKRICLLNQADTKHLQAAANRVAHGLIPDYWAVIVSSLLVRAQDSKGKDLADGIIKPTVVNDIYAVYEPVGGIVLAAGGSERIGRAKQLLSWRSKPLVRHVALTALSAGFSNLVVVVGSFGEDVKRALDDLPVEIVTNSEWKSGQSTSVHAGLRALPVETGAAVFLLADQPRVSSRLIQTLIEAHSTTLGPVIAPIVDGQRGNPVLFDKSTFSDLLSLKGDTGGRALFSRYPVTWIEWHDPTIIQDIDTENDYRLLIEQDK